jgi:hypothetical protein
MENATSIICAEFFLKEEESSRAFKKPLLLKYQAFLLGFLTFFLNFLTTNSKMSHMGFPAKKNNFLKNASQIFVGKLGEFFSPSGRKILAGG